MSASVILERVWNDLWGILGQFSTPSSSMYWPYLLSALGLALLVYVVRSGPKRSLAQGLGFCFPKRIYTHPSARHDVAIFVLNALLYSYVLVGPVTSVSMLSGQHTWSLLERWHGPVASAEPSWGLRLAVTVAVLVAADLAFFLSHLAQHKIRVLWEFHKVHHSAEVLFPLTVFRRHPVDVVIERGLTGALVGVVLGVLGHFTGGGVDELSVLGVNAGLFIFLVLGFNLQHSHVWLSWGRALEHVFVSPALHQVHHSTDPRHFDKNMGNVLAVWDWIAGTLYVPSGRESLQFGLGAHESERYDSVLRLYLAPFARLLSRGNRPQQP